MPEENPLVEQRYLLEKFSGKGGWTYALIPEIPQAKKVPFGWRTVSGTIDGYALKHVKLMPMGNGKLFLPVKAAIRKEIKKEAGDMVKITLYADHSPLEIPEEVILCFENEPKKVYEAFVSFTESEQKAYLDWIYAAKTDETKVSRIVKMMEKLSKKQKLYDKSE
ncbi:YdeI/OmpD-associated family protein [Rapidithrix thailandica]|uniref:YdeI/OmpD-associated family protein n=1 Tax=Rapidithrix thailandica TaxID=413964 RepID=A0AAW9S3E7_9BACT